MTETELTTEGLREQVAEKLWSDEQLTPWSRAFGNPEFRYDMEVLFERVDALLAMTSPALEQLRAERDTLRVAVQRLAAEAHRRKWAHEHASPAAFDVLHRIGNELLAALDAPESPADVQETTE